MTRRTDLCSTDLITESFCGCASMLSRSFWKAKQKLGISSAESAVSVMPYISDEWIIKFQSPCFSWNPVSYSQPNYRMHLGIIWTTWCQCVPATKSHYVIWHFRSSPWQTVILNSRAYQFTIAGCIVGKCMAFLIFWRQGSKCTSGYVIKKCFQHSRSASVDLIRTDCSVSSCLQLLKEMVLIS